MASHAFGAFINLDQTSPITEPPAALPKPPQASSFAPPDLELNQSSTDGRDNGLSEPANPDSAPAPISRNELGKTLPSAHQIEDATDAVQTLSSPPINRYRLLSACCMCFANGLNDSAPGALIPYLEKHYSIGYAVVSLIFVTNAIGFTSAAPLTYALQLRLGRAKMLVLTQLIMMVAYVMLVCQPPFPVVVLSFLFTGLGMAFNLALNNVFCANFANGTTTLGLFHGSYGIGGTIGPLIATALVSHGHSCLRSTTSLLASQLSMPYLPISLSAPSSLITPARSI